MTLAAFLFLSTPSARRATHPAPAQNTGRCNFYPRPPRGGRPPSAGCFRGSLGISIHALREEGDTVSTDGAALGRKFLSTPSARRATSGARKNTSTYLFLSTPSARRATLTLVLSITVSMIFLSTPSARRATAKTETKSLFSYKLYNILHEFRRALIYNGSKNYPNHAKRLENPVRRCRKDAENSPFAPGRKTQNNSRPSCSKGG